MSPKVRIPWAAIMRRIRWAAKRAGLVVPKHITIVERGRGRGGNSPSNGGDCRPTARGFLITINVEPILVAGVEEVLLHEVAHAIAWTAKVERNIHTPAWAACYGALYAGYFDHERQGPQNPEWRLW